MANAKTWIARIWTEFHAGNLSRTERDALLTLATYRDRGGLAWPAHRTIAARAKCGIRSVQRALQRAKTLGLLRWVHRRIRRAWRSLQSSNAYRFTQSDRPVQRQQRPTEPRPSTDCQSSRRGESKARKRADNEALLAMVAGLPDLLAARRAHIEATLATTWRTQ